MVTRNRARPRVPIASSLRSPEPIQKVRVELDAVEWRAIAAMLYATTQSTASNPAHRTLFNRLYDEICEQAEIEISPPE